ncbi:MAG: acetyl-CoA hydrolase/transferase C-terminal domain-containing protein [Bacteroidales bacterium]|nr:acetyl-CoA hydrolase/transferase C-terminal domain-containing protein [Bacteroidales bacterium]
MNIPEITAAEAAAMICHEEWIGVGGFGPAGSPKSIPAAIAARAREEHDAGRPFKVNVVTGASIGASCDGELAAADAIDRRLPFSVNAEIRKAYNSGRVRYTDLNLSDNATFLRQGITGPVDWGIIEACDIQEIRGRIRIYLTAGIGIAPTICHKAVKGVFIELNSWHSTRLIGMHDIYEIEAPWYRSPIRITQPVELIGLPYIEVAPEQIKGIVLTHQPDEARAMTGSTPVTDRIGQHMADFLVDNIRQGYINGSRLTLQSGVGSGANAVLGALGSCPEVPNFNIYTEVLQEEPLRLIREGRVVSASTGALTISSEHLVDLYKNIADYRGRLLIRPSEISNCPEIIARLGICSLNTAIEVDIYGHVNSTKICGTKMMNGVGGSADFTCNAMLASFTCGSTAKDGKISSIVPFCSHVDHTEHYVDAVITEYGVADLRGKCAREKAEALVAIAHPDYRPLLRDYLKLAERYGGHTHHVLNAAFAMHDTFRRKGDMRLTDWSEYLKD